MRNAKLLWVLALVALIGFTAAACTTATEEPMTEPEAVTEAEQPVAEPTEAEMPTEEPTEEVMAEDIVAVLVADGRFMTLVDLVTTAGLAETLQGEGPFTVFAPTDEAFAALPEGTLDELTPEDISAILLGHVVEGNVMAADVVTLADTEVETVGGDLWMVTVDGETVMIGDATVIEADLEASNGVIHVIDMVLLAGEGEMDE